MKGSLCPLNNRGRNSKLAKERRNHVSRTNTKLRHLRITK